MLNLKQDESQKVLPSCPNEKATLKALRNRKRLCGTLAFTWTVMRTVGRLGSVCPKYGAAPFVNHYRRSIARYISLSLLMVLLALPFYNLKLGEPARRETQPPQHDDVIRANPREIDHLIGQLSSSSFGEREEAARRLEEIGDPTVKALRAATGKGAGLELRRRAEQLLAVILNKDLGQRFGENVATVEKILPPGWSVMRTVSGSTPPDWWTNDPDAGFLVEAQNDKDILQIWFLPLDWVGIRKVPNRACGAVYWQGVLAGEKYKTITFASDDTLQSRVQHLGGHSMSTPCLTNSGYDRALRLFAGKLDRADRVAASLIEQHCRTSDELDEAVFSLNVLGVPSCKLFLRIARQARGPERGRYTSLLGLLGGEEAIGLLCDIATDLQVPAPHRHYAVMDLDQYQDRRIGPCVHTALKQMPDGESLACVAKVLAHRRYKPAEADLLDRFKLLPNTSYAKGSLAQTLAAFRCQAAIPELRRVLRELPRKQKESDDPPGGFDLALLRLTGDWGEASEDARLFVVPPKRSRLGEKMELTVYLEASGVKPIRIGPLPRERGLLVDGKSVFKDEEIGIIMGPIWSLSPGDVWSFTCDLTPYVKAPGVHKVQYDSWALVPLLLLSPYRPPSRNWQ